MKEENFLGFLKLKSEQGKKIFKAEGWAGYKKFKKRKGGRWEGVEDGERLLNISYSLKNELL